VGDRHDLDPPVFAEPFGFVGQEGGERLERAARLADRLHLLPVAEQHDRHEQGELPPELEVEPPDGGRHRRRPGDRDRHRDQQHHPRTAVAHFGDRAGEEWVATPGEDQRAEHRTDPADAVDLVAEPLHHHLAGADDGDRQQQGQPEPPAERLGIVTGMLVVRVVARVVPLVRVMHLGPGLNCNAHAVYPRGVSGERQPEVWRERVHIGAQRSDFGTFGG
jgi:hypothetical protein